MPMYEAVRKCLAVMARMTWRQIGGHFHRTRGIENPRLRQHPSNRRYNHERVFKVAVSRSNQGPRRKPVRTHNEYSTSTVGIVRAIRGL